MSHSLSTRREFLHKGLGLLVAGTTVPAFLEQTAWALTRPEDQLRTQPASGKDGTILVVVQLAGGNDGLNMIIPHGDDAYYRARPVLGIEAKSVLKIDDYLGLHPEMTELKKLIDDGSAAVVQGVGYPNPNRSHFRSMDIWQSGEPERQSPTSGWLGRYFDNTCSGEDPHAGMAIGGALPLAMQGERIVPLAFERPETYRYNGRDRERFAKLNEEKAIATTHPGNLDFLRRTAMDAQASSEQIARLHANFQSGAQYPRGEFGNGLRTVAAMIGGGLSTRVYYVSLGGFDTHAQQRGRQDQLLKQLAEGLGAFWADMKQQQNQQRVLVMTFSEFGRRVGQNASAGTDHGAAAPMLLLGTSLKRGVVGKHPSLTDLDQGDLKFGVDFRSVYAAVLEQWLRTPSKPILGRAFAAAEILKG